MTALSTPKQTTSIKLSIDTKQALERFAQQENRSVHYMLVTAVEEFITRKQAEAEYQEYIKDRVMKALNRFESEGSNGIPSEQVFDVVMQRIADRKQIGK